MKTTKNFWPLGITLASLFYVSGVGVCSYLACTHRSELVNENYYDQEIKYQSRIDSARRARQLATPVAASYDDASKSILISLPLEHAGKEVTGEVELYRPSAAGQDQHFKLEPDARGAQIIPAAALEQGLWKVRVTWSVAGQDYFFDEKIAVGPAALQAELAAMNKPPGIKK